MTRLACCLLPFLLYAPAFMATLNASPICDGDTSSLAPSMLALGLALLIASLFVWIFRKNAHEGTLLLVCVVGGPLSLVPFVVVIAWQENALATLPWFLLSAGFFALVLLLLLVLCFWMDAWRDEARGWWPVAVVFALCAVAIGLHRTDRLPKSEFAQIVADRGMIPRSCLTD